MSVLKVATFSDIHLAHRSNPTKNIIANLYAALPDNAETAELDILFLAGDVFDRLVNLPEQEVTEIDLWMCTTLRICKKHNIMLRIVDGTKSHDWFQAARFMELNTITGTNADVQYFKDLTIEHIDKFNIDILYVPDEWSSSTADTLQQVRSLLAVKGLEKVDLSIMHGQFGYQMPSHVKKVPLHDEQAYLDITRYYVFIGHVHVHTHFQRILAQGSFDRLSHGEESPKGHIRAQINLETGEKHWFFIENKGARIYKTIRCEDTLNLEDSLAKIRSELDGVPDFSAIRVYANAGHPVLENKTALAALSPLMTWTVLGKDAAAVVTVQEDEIVENAIAITPDNIISLLMARINAIGVDPTLVEKCSEILTDVI